MNPTTTNRRAFLQTAAGLLTGPLLAQSNADWKKQIGLELHTVRDLLAKDFEGTMAKVAEIGYREVEPTSYGGLDPKQFRALLDRCKLTAPSTHAAATDGPDIEKQLEGHQIMGFKYTEIRAGRPAGGGAGAGKKGGGKNGAAKKAAPAERPTLTVDAVKRTAQQYNRHRALTKKFGMKILVHNHAVEFERLENSDLTQYDVLLAETDPSLVAMQMDIGWVRVAGRDPFTLFQKHPGRFELWHVKDEVGLKSIDPSLRTSQRRAKFVPIGQGEVDYKPIFAKARQAGMKHYVIEQDNAAENGADSLAAAAANYKGLMKVLS